VVFAFCSPIFSVAMPSPVKIYQRFIMQWGAFFKGIQDSERNRPAASQTWALYYKPDKLPYPKAMQQNIPQLLS